MPPTTDLSDYRAGRPAEAPADSFRPSRLALAGRVALGLGGVLIAVSAVISWAVGLDAVGQPVSYRPTQGSGEGVYMIVAGIVVLALAARRTIVETTNRWLQLVPLAAVLVAWAMWLDANRRSLAAVLEWQRSGGSGTQTDGPMMAALGMVGVAVAAALLELARPAGVRAETRRLGADTHLTRQEAATIGVAIVAGSVGAVVGLSATITLLSVYSILAAMLFAVVGFMVGAWLGLRIMRRRAAGAGV